MKMGKRRLLAAAVLVLMVLTAVLQPVRAADQPTGVNHTGKRYNIMLVIDGSGSLVSYTRTDPAGMRYELISDLFGILEDDGHNVGAVVFSGNHGPSTDQEAMERGIRLNTGLMTLDRPAPDGKAPKDHILDAVIASGVDNTPEGTTDIGTALLVAQRQLQQLQEQNGLESLVFLFTDGCTSMLYEGPREKAMENQRIATQEMKESGIRLMGAFLNKDGKIRTSEIQDMVCNANGITPDSEEFRDSYVEITDAASCHMAVNTLLSFLGYVSDVEPQVLYGDLTDTFTIPGAGVEEMNIRLYSENGEDLPDLQVSLTKPDGTVLKDPDLAGICRRSRTFRVYKLDDPMPGQWTLKIRVPENAQVRYYYSPVSSVYVDGRLQISPEADSLYWGLETEFLGTLLQGETPIEDPAAYEGYTCSLDIYDKQAKTTRTFPMDFDENGRLVYKGKLDAYGDFTAKAFFSCGEIHVESQAVDFRVINQPPQVEEPKEQKLRYGLFEKGSSVMDLTPFYNDREDGANVKVSVDDTTCNQDGFRLVGSTLELQHKVLGDGTIRLLVTDSLGESSQLTLTFVTASSTVWWILALVILLIILALIAVRMVIYKNSHRPDGVLTVSFACHTERGSRDVSLDLPVPGADTVSKASLEQLLSAAVRDLGGNVSGFTPEQIGRFLRQYAGELKKVTLSADTRKVGRRTRGAVAVRDGRKNNVLLNSGCTLDMEDGSSFELTFSTLLEEEDPFDTDLPAGKKPAAGLEDDDFFDF